MVRNATVEKLFEKHAKNVKFTESGCDIIEHCFDEGAGAWVEVRSTSIYENGETALIDAKRRYLIEAGIIKG